MVALALAGLSAISATLISQPGSGSVISDPSSGTGSSSGTVDRGTTGSTSGSTSGSTDSSTGTTTTTKTVKLSWMAPLVREDGEPLLVGEIKGYRIRIEKKGSTTITYKSLSGTTSSSSITLSESGTYMFSIAAVDVSGIYSDYSARISTTF